MTQLLTSFEPGNLILTDLTTQMWSVSTPLKPLNNGEWNTVNFNIWNDKPVSCKLKIKEVGGRRTLPS